MLSSSSSSTGLSEQGSSYEGRLRSGLSTMDAVVNGGDERVLRGRELGVIVGGGGGRRKGGKAKVSLTLLLPAFFQRSCRLFFCIRGSRMRH